jgi:glycine/D-amino acid oxidase-like deaminating enzyme/nitrite reductase/ring-hydroxylating ferredoxin subunit
MTTSLWQGTFDVPSFPALERDSSVDVCVVGAGIAGLSTAYMLAKAGQRVVVLDDGPIGGGETGHTTAHLTAAFDDRIFALEQVHGETAARRIVESHTAAINRIEQIVGLEGIACDFQRVDGFLFLGPDDDEALLDRELAAARRAGLADVMKTDRAPIADWDSGPALRFPWQGQLHALKYIAGLAEALVRAGGRIYCDTHVSSVKGGRSCTVTIDKRHTVKAAAVCVCTNSSITDMVQTHVKAAPYRTYVIAATVPRGSVATALYWDTPHPYHYVRVQPLDEPYPGVLAGDAQYDALIVGGEDHKTGHADDADDRWRRLEEWMRQRWPVAREVTYRWSGQVIEPADYAAFIGPNPDGAQNVYMAGGDSGQGMTHGTVAGILLTDLILGHPNPWAEVYDPRRVSLRVAPLEEMAKENLDVAFQFVRGYAGPSDVSSEDEIPRGEGRVIRRGLHRLAVYRDESGTLHERSAVCTHLKCTVAWNSAERSWDCPCHGSRFDPYGRVLNGPAVTDLEPAAEPTPARTKRVKRKERA